MTGNGPGVGDTGSATRRLMSSWPQRPPPASEPANSPEPATKSLAANCSQGEGEPHRLTDFCTGA